jgi:hypothetical protein
VRYDRLVYSLSTGSRSHSIGAQRIKKAMVVVVGGCDSLPPFVSTKLWNDAKYLNYGNLHLDEKNRCDKRGINQEVLRISVFNCG